MIIFTPVYTKHNVMKKSTMKKPAAGSTGTKPKDGIGMSIYNRTVGSVKPPAKKPVAPTSTISGSAKPKSGSGSTTVSKGRVAAKRTSTAPTATGPKSTMTKSTVVSTKGMATKPAVAKTTVKRNPNQLLTKNVVTVREDGAMNRSNVSYRAGEGAPADTLYKSNDGSRSIKPSDVMRRPKRR